MISSSDKQILKVIGIPLILVLPLILLITMVTCDSSSGGNEVIAGVMFTTPFKEGVPITITSPFGWRDDPLNQMTAFHNGLDLDAPDGSEVVAAADGYVVETGYQENGLGNYVYVEHNFDGIVYYSAYGHMLDGSIVVSEGEPVKAKQKLGIIGASGRVTGTHLHFMLMTPKLSYEQKYLVDPLLVIEGLK